MISTTSFGIANFMESITVQGTQRLVILLSASGNPLNKIESRSKLAATSEHLSSAYQKQGRQRVRQGLCVSVCGGEELVPRFAGHLRARSGLLARMYKQIVFRSY